MLSILDRELQFGTRGLLLQRSIILSQCGQATSKVRNLRFPAIPNEMSILEVEVKPLTVP